MVSAPSPQERCIETWGEFTASEVTEDNIVCGIELSPNKSGDSKKSGDDVATIATYPSTSLSSSESWSLSNNSLIEAAAQTYGKLSLGGNGRDPLEIVKKRPSFLCSSTRSSIQRCAAEVCGPVSDIYTGTNTKNATKPQALRIECDTQEETTRFEMVLLPKRLQAVQPSAEEDQPQALRIECDTSEETTRCEVLLMPKKLQAIQPSVLEDRQVDETKVPSKVQEREIINVMEPKPDSLFPKLMMNKPSSFLCSMVLSGKDVNFVLKTRQHSKTNDEGLHPPFVMFPNQTSVFVSKSRQSQVYQLLSRGPIPVDSVPELFRIQNSIVGGFVSIKAFCDGVPALDRQKPLALHDSNFSILLDDWCRKKKRVVGAAKLNSSSASSSSQETCKMQIHIDNEYEHFFCNPSSLPLMTSPSSKADDTSLFRDKELQAVMRITQDGNDTSALFPSFSDAGSSFEAESDDGLRDEMGALDDVQKELHTELHIAETVIKGTGGDIFEALEYLAKKSPRATNPSPRRTYVRRVHFSNYNEERVFIADAESRSEESRNETNYGCDYFCDEMLYSFEETVNFFSKRYATYMERGRSPQHREQPDVGRRPRTSQF